MGSPLLLLTELPTLLPLAPGPSGDPRVSLGLQLHLLGSLQGQPGVWYPGAACRSGSQPLIMKWFHMISKRKKEKKKNPAILDVGPDA